MSEVRIDYPPGDSPKCAPFTCPRAVTRPHFLPSLKVGPWGEETVYPMRQADGTMTVWHRPGCAALSQRRDEGAA